MSADNSTLVVPQFPEIVGVLFKLIPGYPGYAADSLGRIWSCKRGKWRRMRAWVNSGRYLRVSVSVGGRAFTQFVHVLVLTAFSGGHPEGYQAMHHPDPTPTNNHPLNLMWGTRSENNKQAYRDGKTFHHRHGGDHHLSSLTRDQVRSLYRRAETESLTALAAEFGISIYQASAIAHGKSWKSAGLPYRDKLPRRTSHRGEENGACKLTRAQVESIRERFATGTETKKGLAREFGVSTTLIYKILKGELRKHG